MLQDGQAMMSWKTRLSRIQMLGIILSSLIVVTRQLDHIMTLIRIIIPNLSDLDYAAAPSFKANSTVSITEIHLCNGMGDLAYNAKEWGKLIGLWRWDRR